MVIAMIMMTMKKNCKHDDEDDNESITMMTTKTRMTTMMMTSIIARQGGHSRYPTAFWRTMHQILKLPMQPLYSTKPEWLSAWL